MPTFTFFKTLVSVLVALMMLPSVNAQCPSSFSATCGTSFTNNYTTTIGTSTFVVPAGVTSINIQVWGGGGRAGNRTTAGGSAGGGGGAYSQTTSFAVTPFQVLTISVGAGSNSVSTTSALPGGDSWVSLTGVAPTSNAEGVLAKGGSSVITNGITGGAGGLSTAGFGVTRTSGSNGGNGGNVSGNNGGNGGAAANTAGGGGASVNGATVNNTAGTVGNVIGGGGSGAKRTTSATSAGGNGARGEVRITYNLPATTPVGVTNGGPVTSYCNLGKAFEAINAGVHTGAVQIRINGNTWETDVALLNASGTGCSDYSSIVIYPTVSNVSIGGDVAGNMILLDGADNVTFDGRLNLTGASHQLTIVNYSNTNTATNPSTIRFINSAEDNTIQHAVIQGATRQNTFTTINLGATVVIHSSAAGAGNDDILIQHCRFTNAGGNRPTRVIGILGTIAHTNNNIQILNNEFFNLFNEASSSRIILAGTGVDGLTIEGNSFYETAGFVPTSANPYNFIEFNNTNAVTVEGNYFGGTEALCGGSNYSIASASSTGWSIRVINSNYSGLPTVIPSIQNNIFTKFSLSNSSAISPIEFITNSGTSLGHPALIIGNTIGSGTSTGQILMSTTGTTPTTRGIFWQMGASTNTTLIDNNVIGGITLSSPLVNNASRFYAINTTQAAGTNTEMTISRNIIRNITATQTGTGGSNPQFMRGIESTTGQDAKVIVVDNTIEKFTNNGTNNLGASGVVGILVSGAGNTEVKNNLIRRLATTDANVSVVGLDDATLAGIRVTATGNNGIGNSSMEISGNTIFNLSNTNTAALANRAYGIYFAGTQVTGTSLIFNNYIDSIHLASTSASAAISGIFLNQSTTGVVTSVRRLYNNIIHLGSANSENQVLRGIYETGTNPRDNQIYFNTIYIGGSVASSSANSAAMILEANNASNLRNVRNNILVNARANTSGTGKHYGLIVNNSTGLTLDFNNYFVNGTGGVLGFNGADVNALPILSGQDVNSLNLNPAFANPGGSLPEDYIPSTALAGIDIPSVTTDFVATARPATPKMGAFEFSICLATASNITGSSSIPINTSTTLGLSITYTDPFITYQWRSGSTAGGPYTSTLGTNATQNTGNLSVNTYYICEITCSNTLETFTTPEFLVTVTAPVVSFTPAPDEPCSITTDLPVNLLGDVVMSNFSNSSATTTPLTLGLTAPSCQGNYGRDVWFRAVVPASGVIAINVQSATDLIADAWVTSNDLCTGTFTNVGCGDNEGFGNNPWLQVTSVTPGRPVWIRVARQGSLNPGANFGIGISEGAVWSGAFDNNMLQQTDNENGDNNWKFIDNTRLNDLLDPIVAVVKTNLTNYPVLSGSLTVRGVTFRRNTPAAFGTATISVASAGELNIDRITGSESGFIKSNLNASTRGKILGPGILSFQPGVKTYNVEALIDFGGVVIARAGTTVNSNGNMIFLNNSSLLSGNTNRDGFDGTGTVVGNIRYQRAGTTTPGVYNYWSTPVNGAPISVLNNAGLGNNIYLYDNQRTGAGSNVLLGWEGPITASSTPTNTGAAMIAGKGYIQTVAGNGNVTFVGTPRQTNVNAAVTTTLGNNFNLIGNPYPSALTLSQAGSNPTSYFFGNNLGVQGAYLWRNLNLPPYGGAGYITITSLGLSGASAVAAGVSSFTLPQIGAAQGFMVLVTNGTTGVNLNGTMRLTSIPGNNPQFLDVNEFSTARIRIFNADESLSYETMLAFKEDATDGIDHQQDAVRFPIPLGLEIFTVNGDNNFVIQALPTLHNGRVIPMGTQMAVANGSYKIRLTEFSNFDESTRVYLEDLATGAFHNLSQNNTYDFVNLSWAGERFKLHFRAPIAMAATGACAGDASGKLILNNPNPTAATLTVKNAEGMTIAQESNWMGDKVINNLSTGNYNITVAYEPTDVINMNASIANGSLTAPATFSASSTVVTLADASIEFTGNNNGATTYSWNFGDGNTVNGVLNPVHTYTAAGQYTVTFTTSSNGCESTTTKVINVNGTVGINDIANGNSFSIYPNPSADIAYVMLNMAANEKDVMVSIIDGAGRVVSKERVNEVRNGSVVTLNVSEIANGIYEVVVENRNFRAIGKLSVTH